MSGASGSTLSEMALAGMAGRAMAGTVGTGASRVAKTAKAAPKTAARKTTGGGDEAAETKPRAVVTGVAAELREFTKLRDEGILTDEEYTEQKNRLLGR
jgi:Short C-terminal domain